MSEVVLESRSLEARLPASPWTGRASTAAGLVALLSLAGVIVGWEGASHESTFADAQPWFFVGVIGLLLGFAAAVGWLNSAARRIRVVRLECHDILRREFGLDSEPGDEIVREVRPRYVRAAGMVKVHLDTCELIVGKAYDEVPFGSEADRCGVCCP